MKKQVVYELTIVALAIVSVVIAIIDLTGDLNTWQHLLDYGILSIFVMDYFYRLFQSDDKRLFFQKNILDLLAILPFSAAFRAFRIVKFFKFLRLLKFLKMLRIVVYLGRGMNIAKNFFDTNGFKYVLLLTITSILSGGILIHLVEKMSVADGIWWAFVTATTVGYGDISPHTTLGRIIAMVLMLLGIGLIGSLTSTITAFFIHANSRREVKHKSVRHEFADVIKKKLDHPDRLTSQDIKDITKMLQALDEIED